MPTPRPNPWPRALAALAVLLLATGCAQPVKPIFPALDNAPVWPSPPETPRVAYVGELATSADLKPVIPLAQRIGQALFGKKDVSSMLTPYGVCTDDTGRLFVTDTQLQVVHVFDLETRQYQRWTTPKSATPFTQPMGVAYDSAAGRLFVTDSVARRVYAFDRNGTYQGETPDGVVERPVGICFDRAANRLLVADAATHQLVVLSPDGHLLDRVGRRGTGLGEFNFPTHVAADSQGRVYVSDSLNFRVQQFDPDLRPTRQIGRKGDMPGYFSQPKGVAVDRDDHLYVVDANFEAVQIFDADGQLLMDFGGEGHGPGEFWLPAGIFVDRHNRLWITDTYNRRVQVLDYLPEKKP